MGILNRDDDDDEVELSCLWLKLEMRVVNCGLESWPRTSTNDCGLSCCCCCCCWQWSFDLVVVRGRCWLLLSDGGWMGVVGSCCCRGGGWGWESVRRRLAMAGLGDWEALSSEGWDWTIELSSLLPLINSFERKMISLGPDVMRLFPIPTMISRLQYSKLGYLNVQLRV